MNRQHVDLHFRRRGQAHSSIASAAVAAEHCAAQRLYTSASGPPHHAATDSAGRAASSAHTLPALMPRPWSSGMRALPSSVYCTGRRAGSCKHGARGCGSPAAGSAMSGKRQAVGFRQGFRGSSPAPPRQQGKLSFHKRRQAPGWRQAGGVRTVGAVGALGGPFHDRAMASSRTGGTPPPCGQSSSPTKKVRASYAVVGLASVVPSGEEH